MSDARDPMEFMKAMWGNMGFTLPGMVTPTIDTDELDKRIAELKTVEGWLKSNLSLLQMTIHGLEVQRTTLATMKAMSESANSTDPGVNPFANPVLWQWPFMPSASPAPAASGPPEGKPGANTPTESDPPGRPKRKR